MSALAVESRRARLEEVKADPLTMDVLCQRVADGETLKAIADAWGVSRGLLGAWIAEDDGRRGRYEGALALWADMEAQSCLAIADDGSNDTYIDEGGVRRVDTDVLARSKLRIDTRLKLASKWDRSRYGEKAEVGGGAGGLTIVIQQLDGTMVPMKTIEAGPGGYSRIDEGLEGGGEVLIPAAGGGILKE